ncbi:hypothetical protein [Xanthomonas sp. WHRI 8932A]|uniref:hypothetical protein n=1 Tax=unclassified Xanthomonas TaxID=2643310 RepID=UPI002B225E1B|nr:hypothetical protein [Xanthomonas sp. WHRI 8932A]MEA9565882.1 hypothetical protein [Xanthomonas sp. WHRI 8932A]
MRAWLLLLVGTVLWVGALPAWAQAQTETRLRDALRQTSARLRQVEADLAQQQLATAAAQRERDAAQRPTPAAAAPAENGVRLAALQRELEQQRQALAAERAQRAQTSAAQQQALAQQQHQQQQALLAERTQTRERLSRCNAEGDAFYASAQELAVLYRDPAFVRFVRGRGRELFGMSRVARENRVHALQSTIDARHAQLRTCLDGGALPTAPTTAAP